MSDWDYRTRPQAAEAVKWDPADMEQAGAMIGWLMARGAEWNHPSGMGETTTLAIMTPEGEMTALRGDWVVRFVHIGFMVFRPLAFGMLFERAGGPDAYEAVVQALKGHLVPSPCLRAHPADYEAMRPFGVEGP